MTDESVAPHALDNPVRASLSGPHAHLAEHHGTAWRYPPDVAPFLAFPSDPTTEAWADARTLVPLGQTASVVWAGGPVPAGWAVLRELVGVQMVAAGRIGRRAPGIVQLGGPDVDEMLTLTRETAPGPFLRRTIALGTYLGARHEGALIAMAGERLRTRGWTEISAVCTSPTHRGRGLAAQLIGAVAAQVEERGDRAFLHAAIENTNAIRLYEHLGFTVRRQMKITIVTPAQE